MKTTNTRYSFTLFIIGIALSVLFINTVLVSGQTPQLPVFLNEVQPNPLPPNGDYDGQFIELWNPNASDVDLEGFVIRDILSPGTGQTSYVIPSGTIISANSALALYNTQTGIVLDSKDVLRLDNAQGQKEDGFSYDTAQAGFDAGDLFGRTTGEDGTGDWQICDTATPNAPNDVSCDNATVELAATLNEISPLSDPQYIEIWNPNSDPLDLGGFTLSNNESRASYTIPANTIVQPDSGVSFDSNTTGIILSTADTVRLADANGNQDDGFEFDTVADGLQPGDVYGRQAGSDGVGDWKRCENGSPGAESDNTCQGDTVAVGLLGASAESHTSLLLIITSVLFAMGLTTRYVLRRN